MDNFVNGGFKSRLVGLIALSVIIMYVSEIYSMNAVTSIIETINSFLQNSKVLGDLDWTDTKTIFTLLKILILRTSSQLFSFVPNINEQ